MTRPRKSCRPFNENIDDLERRYYVGTLQYVNDQVDTINSLDPDMSEFVFDYSLAKKYGIIDFIISQEKNNPFLFELSQFLTTHIPNEINGMLNLTDYSIDDFEVAYAIWDGLEAKLKELKGEKGVCKINCAFAFLSK